MASYEKWKHSNEIICEDFEQLVVYKLCTWGLKLNEFENNQFVQTKH